jgi:hypothetical protein
MKFACPSVVLHKGATNSGTTPGRGFAAFLSL